MVRVHNSVTDPLLMWTKDNDMAARKDAVMQNIRQELALANAQELMNVWTAGTLTSVEQPIDPPPNIRKLQSGVSRNA